MSSMDDDDDDDEVEFLLMVSGKAKTGNGQNVPHVIDLTKIDPVDEGISHDRKSQASSATNNKEATDNKDAKLKSTNFGAASALPPQPAAKVGSKESTGECTICLEPFTASHKNGAETFAACFHSFHANCLAKWTAVSSAQPQSPSPKCPICRNPIF